MTNKHEMLNSKNANQSQNETLLHTHQMGKNKIRKHQMLPRMCEKRNSYITGWSVN